MIPLLYNYVKYPDPEVFTVTRVFKKLKHLKNRIRDICVKGSRLFH